MSSVEARELLRTAEQFFLFLDYDGTLADFAPTPAVVSPNEEIIEILTSLKNDPRFQVAVISGRRLDHLRALIPIDGILLSGTYGIEILFPDGNQFDLLDYSTIRPPLENIKNRWTEIIRNRRGFFLEDKGWSLAIHARFAEDEEAADVLSRAQALVDQNLLKTSFRLLGGHKFLEIAPQEANKGRSIHFLLDRLELNGALPIYVGDDDKDEDAFKSMRKRGGISILVSQESRATHADLHLPSPASVRLWLRKMQYDNPTSSNMLAEFEN